MPLKDPEARKAYKRAWREANKERLALKDRAYRLAHQEQHRIGSRARIAKEPHKHKARQAVTNAIRDGRLVRPNHCSKCDALCKPEGHHEDYTKQLQVMWLCKSCHVEIHRSTLSRSSED